MRALAQLAYDTPRTARRWLFALAIVLATVGLAQDSRPVNASGPEILISLSNTTPAPLPVFYLVPGGPSATLYVWAKNVDQATSSFQVDITYDNSVVSVDPASVVAYEDWLELYGRSAMCASPLVEPVSSGEPEGPWHVNVSCITTGVSGSGTQGTGLLASFALEAASELGVSDLTLTEATSLLDMNIDPPGHISIKLRSSVARTAPCADFGVPDGQVTIGDIVYILSRFGTEDPALNLDGYDLVTIADIVIALGQYGSSCQ